ncbi:glycosyltransferase family 4 protein [Pistricoccus aurantiacus]|uniref:glycosyltransferase family 4 protein n=1 Tax=Pistricoccus aurantiacus TaxID=1883414 RepID=UPI00362AC556
MSISVDSPAPRDLVMIVPGDPDQRTGGYLYDARIVEALRRQGHRVEVIGLEGNFPQIDCRAREALQQALRDQPEGQAVIIDGLALGNLPAVAAEQASRLDLTALVHHPLGDESGLSEPQRDAYLANECQALGQVARVIVTSNFTARRLKALGVEGPIHVVEPGVDSAPLAERAWPAPPGQPVSLLCVATLTPRKGHAVLIEALADLIDHEWHCRLIGAADRDPDWTQCLRDQTREFGLESRISFDGECDVATLEAAYHQADVLVLPSFYEGYGMVITEALARGLPVIATTGGALADTLPAEAGWRVPPGDSKAFARALREWFENPPQREGYRAGAVAARQTLADWTSAGIAFARALSPSRPDEVSP